MPFLHNRHNLALWRTYCDFELSFSSFNIALVMLVKLQLMRSLKYISEFIANEKKTFLHGLRRKIRLIFKRIPLSVNNL